LTTCSTLRRCRHRVSGNGAIMRKTLTVQPFETAGCDRCGDPACVRAALPRGGELFLCAPHANQHMHRLCELHATFEAYVEAGR